MIRWLGLIEHLRILRNLLVCLNLELRLLYDLDNSGCVRLSVCPRKSLCLIAKVSAFQGVLFFVNNMWVSRKYHLTVKLGFRCFFEGLDLYIMTESLVRSCRYTLMTLALLLVACLQLHMLLITLLL